MDRKREPKKSDTFDIRLPHEVKKALMRKAKDEGRSASEVIRKSIHAYLADPPKETPKMLITAWKPIALAGAVGAAILWTAVAPSPLAAGTDLRRAFDAFDRNKDGKLTLDEFRAGHSEDRMFVRPAKSPAPSKPFMIPVDVPPVSGSAVPDRLLKSEFAKEDKDRSGSVDFNEFKRFHLAMVDESFAAADRNRDGNIDRDELTRLAAGLPAGGPRPAFAKLDRNHDGRIDRREFLGDADWGR